MTSEHVLDLNLASALRISKEEEFAHTCDYIEGVEGLRQVFQLGERRHQLEDVVLKVFLFEVSIARGVIQ